MGIFALLPRHSSVSKQVAHDDLGLDRFGTSTPRTLARYRREDVNAFGFEGGGDVVC
jgi:hypothetical protein